MQLTDDTLQAQCIRCKDTHVLMVSNHDLKRWEGGELIQNAMPYLTAGEREILISGVCEACFGKMYGEDPIGDADTEYDIKFEEKK